MYHEVADLIDTFESSKEPKRHIIFKNWKMESYVEFEINKCLELEDKEKESKE